MQHNYKKIKALKKEIPQTISPKGMMK